jgi:membrane protein implicated in regulation of membrane protease activity
MELSASLSPFVYTMFGMLVALALVMFAAAVLSPWVAGWLFGCFGNRLESIPAQSDAMAAELAAQIGKRGVARRLMVPSGQVLIGGRSYEATSEGPAIEAGHAVVVVKVATRRLVVRAVTG